MNQRRARRRILSVVLTATAAIIGFAKETPVNAQGLSHDYYLQTRSAPLDTASAMLRLRIPFGGDIGTSEEPTFGLSLAAGTSRITGSDMYGTYAFGGTPNPFPQIAAVSETPFLQAGVTLEGEPFLKLDYVNMAPSTERPSGFLDGDMDGGEVLIFGAVIGASFALYLYLNGGFDDEGEFRIVHARDAEY